MDNLNYGLHLHCNRSSVDIYMNNRFEVVTDFPPKAQAYLTSFYEAKGIKPDNTVGKIEALRKDFIKEDMLVASTEGILDDVSELRALEFYVLDSLKML